MFSIYKYQILHIVLMVLVLVPQQLLAKTPNKTKGDTVAPKITDLHTSESFDHDNGTNLTFYLSVSDNNKIKSVILFHRSMGNKKYIKSKMTPSKEATSYDYTVTLSEIKLPVIEYYVQVEDAAGNLSLRGNSISPLVENTGRLWLPQITYRAKTHVAYLGANAGTDILFGQLGFEYFLSKKLSLGGRFSKHNYKFDEQDRNEDGTGLGGEFTARFFPLSRYFEGFYVGGAIGVWSFYWYWDLIDEDQQLSSENGRADAVSLSAQLGWRFHFGYSNFYFEPQIVVGDFYSFHVETSDDNNVTNLDPFVTGGLSLGMTF